MRAKQVAAMAGISVRTLHHYDRIGLLSPDRNRENGYRVYTEADLDRLQQILFFKACGFTLANTKQLLESPSFDREQAFLLQRKYLLHERRRIDAMLNTLEQTMRAAKGECMMTQQEKFEGFDFSQNPYEEEARRLWGDEAVDSGNAHIAALSEEERAALGHGMDALFSSLAELRGEDPASERAQAAMEEMYRHFNQNFGRYTPEAFAGLGRLYVEDSRFTQNIDRYGQGLSAFLMEAMGIFARNRA